MGTAGNKASRGVNVRGGGASIGQVSVQALPPAGIPAAQTRVVGATNNISTPTITNFSARLSPASNSSGAQANLTFQGNVPPSVRLVSPTLPQITSRSDQILSVSRLQVGNGTFVPRDNNGINSLRPEIVSLLDFKSVIADSNGSFTKAGRLFDLQFQAKALREKTLLDLITNIRGAPGTGDYLDNVQSQFYAKFTKIDGLVNFYKTTIANIDKLKAAFDIKHIPNTAFNSTYFQTLRNFYTTHMVFPGNSFMQFSNTKLLYQLMFDFRSILENYSMTLLDLNDPTRTSDQDPIKIDKTYTTQNGFSFTLDTIRSPGTIAQNAAGDAFFVRFLQALPAGADDRIKLMVAILSKELRVSSGLGQTDVQAFLQSNFSFTATTQFPSPFPNLIGTVGDTALDPPAGTNSLSSLFFLDLSANSFVLPFETNYIDVSNTQKVYVPGSNYFVDSILNVTNNQFNTRPFIDYVQDFTNTLASSMAIIQRLFDFKDTQSPLAGVEVLKTILVPFSQLGLLGLSNSGQTNAGTISTITFDIKNIAIMALFRMAASDNQLKEMLFQYLLLLTLKTQFDTSADLRFITSNIVKEIYDLTGLSFVKLDNNTDPSLQNNRNLTPFINQLGLDIQNRVYQNIAAVPGTGNNSTNPVTDPTTNTNSNSDLQQSDNTRPAANSEATSDASNLQRVTFNVDSVSSLSDTLSNPQNQNTLLTGFVHAAMQLDQAASPGSNTSIYVDNNGRTRLNQLSSTTLLLMLYEVFCDLATNYAVADFVQSSQAGLADMLVDAQFNQTSMGNITSAIQEADIVLTPSIIGIVGSTTLHLGSTIPSTGGSTLAVGGGSGASPSSPGGITINQTTGPALSDAVRQATNLAASIQRTAAQTGTSTGQVQAAQAASQQYTGNQNATSGTRVSTSPVFSISQDPGALLAGRVQEDSLFSIKSKIYEEDLIVANILHILSVVYTSLTSAKEQLVSYFSQATLTNFLQQSFTDSSDLVNLLNPAQAKIIVATRDITTKQLQASGDVRGGNLGGGIDVNGNQFGVGFVSNTPNEINVKNAVLSLLSQPNYQESFLADEKVKVLTIGIPAGFSKNLADRLNTASINQTSFVVDKEFDVVEILIHKRNLEHEELVFKPQKFIFDLSLFSDSFQDLNIATNEDFNNVLQDVKLLDYASIGDPEPHTLSDIDNDQKYGFLTSDERYAMFLNQVTSDVLSSYINYMTAMDFSDDVFVDINSQTYQNLFGSAVPAAGATDTFNVFNAMSQDFQTKVISYLNTVKHKNLPNRSFQDLLMDTTGLVDQDTKDTIRLLSFGNVVFNPDVYMQRLLSPKLFDRVFSVPINVDGFPLDVDMTNSTIAGTQTLESLLNTPGATTIPDSMGEIYLAPRDKTSPVFEDYFVTVDLVTGS